MSEISMESKKTIRVITCEDMTPDQARRFLADCEKDGIEAYAYWNFGPEPQFNPDNKFGACELDSKGSLVHWFEAKD